MVYFIHLALLFMNRDERGYRVTYACQDNWRAGEELFVPECHMEAADGSRNVEYVIEIFVLEENRISYKLL